MIFFEDIDCVTAYTENMPLVYLIKGEPPENEMERNAGKHCRADTRYTLLHCHAHAHTHTQREGVGDGGWVEREGEM